MKSKVLRLNEQELYIIRFILIDEIDISQKQLKLIKDQNSKEYTTMKWFIIEQKKLLEKIKELYNNITA